MGRVENRKLNILLANYRYFISGGPERYLFNLEKELRRHGHEIVPFSIDYLKNKPSPYSKYFVSPIGARDQIYYDQHGKSPAAFLKTLSRLFYSKEVENGVSRLADATSPDIAYVLHYQRKLSPSLLVGLKKKNLPVVVRLSDYMMLCPQAHFLRKGVPCTTCMPDRLLPSVQYKCVKGSQTASLINLVATWYHRKRKFFDLIDSFVCTNQFMFDMMLEAGYPAKRLNCIPTFTDLDHFQPDQSGGKSDYFVFVGRITPIKGLHVLLEAMGKLPPKKLEDAHLKIAGAGDEAYLKQCRDMVNALDLDKHVTFLGEVSTAVLPSLLNRALFSVVPSLWFENLPNSILESYACATPVLASNIGSLTDIVNDGRTGFLFKSGSSEDLADKIEYCLSNPALLDKMSINCKWEAHNKYSPENHVHALLRLFARFL